MTENDIIRTSTVTADLGCQASNGAEEPAGHSSDAVLTDVDLDEVVGGRSRRSTAPKKSPMYKYAMYKL